MPTYTFSGPGDPITGVTTVEALNECEAREKAMQKRRGNDCTIGTPPVYIGPWTGKGLSLIE